MRKLGYILLVSGFTWATFIAVEARPLARALSYNFYQQKVPKQQSFDKNEMFSAFDQAAFRVANFAMLSFIGALLMLAGGIILAKSGKPTLTPTKSSNLSPEPSAVAALGSATRSALPTGDGSGHGR